MNAKKTSWFAVCIFGLSIFVGTASLLGNDSAKPNILLIVSEDNGPELSCYGDPYVKTPVLDQLAADGVRFQNAYVPYSVCSPSRATFLTGLLPHQNGHIGLATHKFALYGKTPSLFSELKQAGYFTGLIGKLHVNPESNFKPHIDYRAISSANFGKNQRSIKKYADAANVVFENSGDRPFFLSINYPDAHFPLHRMDHGSPANPLGADDVKMLPWIGVGSPRLREHMANYYNCLMRMDEGVGLLLSELNACGKADNTLIIYIGDHGAQFSRGKTSVYEAGTRIPMIMNWKGKTDTGVVRDELVDTTDIFPTFLAAAGVPLPDDHDYRGSDLMQLTDATAKPKWRESIYTMTTGSAAVLHITQFAFRDERYKIIYTPKPQTINHCGVAYLNQHNAHFIAGCSAKEIATSAPEVQAAYKIYQTPVEWELYDLKNDPFEWTNIAQSPKHADQLDAMKSKMRDFRKSTRDPMLDPDNLKFLLDEMEATRTSKKRTPPDGWGHIERFSQWLKKED